MNELEEGVAPTDSRLRSDQRLMEFGLWDEANIEKLRLEEVQRARNRKANVGVADSHQINENGIIFKYIIILCSVSQPLYYYDTLLKYFILRNTIKEKENG